MIIDIYICYPRAFVWTESLYFILFSILLSLPTKLNTSICKIIAMPRNTSHVSTRVVAAAPHSSYDMVVHNPRNAVLAEALDSSYHHNMAAAIGPYGLIEAGGDLRKHDYELAMYHKKDLNSCLEKEVHEHNNTRSKLQNMQASYIVAEGHASRLNIYSSELYERYKNLQNRTNIAEEALHVSKMQLAGSQVRIWRYKMKLPFN